MSWTLKLPNLCEFLLYTVKLALFSVSLKPFALFSFLAKGKASGWDVLNPLTSFGNSNTTKKGFGKSTNENPSDRKPVTGEKGQHM